MGRTPCCTKVGLNKGPWTPEEDLRLANYIQKHGEGGWRILPKKAGLLRCGKSCRLRWMNYLRPDVKRGHILPEEEDLILRLHRLLGNRWSLIAGRMPGRTDNEIKNYWNTHLSKKLISQGIDPRTHRPLSESEDIWSNPEDSDTIPNHCHQGISQYTPTPANVNPEDTYPSELVKNPESRESEFNKMPAASQNCDHAVSVALKSCLDDPAYTNNKPFPPPIVRSGVMGTPYVFGESSTCFPTAIHDSDRMRGAHQICYPPSTTACSESSEVVASRHIRSCDITSTVGNSGLHFGHYNSTHVLLPSNPSLGKTQVPHNIQSQEMGLNYSDTLHPVAIDATFNKSSNTNCGAANQVTAFSLPYSIPVTPVGTPVGDANSDMFASFLESFMNEELHLPEHSTAQGHNFVPQLRQNQLGPKNLSYELVSALHAPTAHYHPSG